MTNKEDTWKEELIYINGDLITECGDDIFETYTLLTVLHSEFTLIEEPEEKGIEELENEVMKDDWRYYVPMFFNKINELVNKVNELDRKINKKYCCNCGVELDKNNTALPNMCKECKYGE